MAMITKNGRKVKVREGTVLVQEEREGMRARWHDCGVLGLKEVTGLRGALVKRWGITRRDDPQFDTGELHSYKRLAAVHAAEIFEEEKWGKKIKRERLDLDDVPEGDDPQPEKPRANGVYTMQVEVKKDAQGNMTRVLLTCPQSKLTWWIKPSKKVGLDIFIEQATHIALIPEAANHVHLVGTRI